MISTFPRKWYVVDIFTISIHTSISVGNIWLLLCVGIGCCILIVELVLNWNFKSFLSLKLNLVS